MQDHEEERAAMLEALKAAEEAETTQRLADAEEQVLESIRSREAADDDDEA